MKLESSPKTHTWKTEECETSIPLDDCGLNNASIKLEEIEDYKIISSTIDTNIRYKIAEVQPAHNSEAEETHCSYCDKTFASLSLYHAHIHRNISQNIGYCCQICNEKFKYIRGFRSHLREKHGMCYRLDRNTPRYRCTFCSKRYITNALVLHHQRNAHGDFTAYGPNKIGGVEVDPHDPNFYCKSCSRYYANVYGLRQHIRGVHKNKLVRSTTAISSIPDLNDPNFHCKSCKLTYPSDQNFKNHLRIVQKISRRNPNIIEPESRDPRSYNYKYICSASFRRHMNRVDEIITKRGRQTAERKLKKIKKMDKPDPLDPDFYCKPCHIKYANHGKFLLHLFNLHNIKKPIDNSITSHGMNDDCTPLKAELNHVVEVVDPNDPSFYCKPCNIKYPNNRVFQFHLRIVHK